MRIKRMISILTVVFGLLAISSMSYSQIPGDKLLGTYLTQDKSSKIEFYKLGNKYFGKVVWMKDPNDPKTNKPYLDSDNPDPAKRSLPVMGMDIIHDIVYSKDKWEGGTLYDPNTGKTWDCNISFDGNKLKVKGFWKVSWIGKTETWTKG